MIRVSVFLACALAVGGATVVGCGSDDPASTPSGADGGAPDGTTNTDDGSADSGDQTGDAGCAHAGDEAFDAGTSSTVDGGGQPLVFFDIGGLDRQIDLSRDGKLALLQDALSKDGDVYLYETATGVLTKRTTTGDPQATLATGLSGDGNHISAFHGKDTVVAGLWDGCAGWTDVSFVGGCVGDPANGNPNTETSAFGVNFDGTSIVGSGWNGCTSVSAFLWTRSALGWSPRPLQHLGITGGNNRASVISDDGQVVGGFAQFEAADRVAAIWKADGTGVVLDPTGTAISEVLAVSSDGKMVAGPWNATANGGFYWTEADGVVPISELAEAVPQDQIWLNTIAGTEAKRIIFGSEGDPTWASGGLGSMQVAVVWTKAAGLRKLQDVTAEKGITLPDNWSLTNVLASSADGAVLLGNATDLSGLQPVSHTFVLRLDPSAY